MAILNTRRILGRLNQFPVSGSVTLSDPSFISVTQTNNVTTLGNSEDETDDYFIFKTTIDTGATNTTFSTDAESSDCSFTAATGRFTTTTAGDYRIGITLVFLVSATTSFTIKVYVDGSSVYQQSVTVNSAVDPQPIAINLIESLTADQYVRVRIDRSSDDNIYPRLGSTFTMNRIGPSGGGSGGSGVTINNNTDGNILRSTGGSSTISGIDDFKYDSDNNIVSGSGQMRAQSFAFEGTNDSGVPALYRFQVIGGVLQLVSGSLS